MTARRRILLTGLLVVTVLGLAGCQGAIDAERRLKEALRNTEKLSNTFLYRETVYDRAGAHETDVRGLVEDDFRYKARVAADGRPVLDEVVSDDAIAVRFLEPEALDRFRRPGGSGPAPDEAAATEILTSRRWLLDRAGAPAEFPGAGAGAAAAQQPGADPIADARAVFSYLERAINEAARVVEWNPESLDYRPDEDPFETPQDGSGVRRYDLQPPKLPSASETGTGANQVTPDARHFRKMSVYVKEERIIKVVEKIDVESRLDDLEKIYDTKFPPDRSPAEVAVIAVEALNAIRTGQGLAPIRMRDMEYSLKDLGSPVRIELPADTLAGSAALLVNRGRTVTG